MIASLVNSMFNREFDTESAVKIGLFPVCAGVKLTLLSTVMSNVNKIKQLPCPSISVD